MKRPNLSFAKNQSGVGLSEANGQSAEMCTPESLQFF